MERVRKVFRQVIEYITKPQMRILPGQLAFFFIVSLIPLIALVGTIAGYLSISTTDVEKIVETIIPFEITDNIISFAGGKGITFNIAVFFISAFILASNGAHSMIITSNEIYKVECSNIIKRRLKAIGMTVILVLLLLFLLIVPVFGEQIFNLVTSSATDINMVNNARKIYSILQYPISLILVFYNIRWLYKIAPDRKIKNKTTIYGSIFTTIGWIVATRLYAIYAFSFSNYNIFYGSISDIIFLLMWIYILSYIFVLGMAFNATSTEKDDYETMKLSIQ